MPFGKKNKKKGQKGNKRNERDLMDDPVYQERADSPGSYEDVVPRQVAQYEEAVYEDLSDMQVPPHSDFGRISPPGGRGGQTRGTTQSSNRDRTRGRPAAQNSSYYGARDRPTASGSRTTECMLNIHHYIS